MESLTERLMRQRIADVEQATATRMGRALQSDLTTDRVREARLEPKQPTADTVARGERTDDAKAERIRDPEQHRFRPPGYSMGLGPTPVVALVGTVTTRQATMDRMLDPVHARQAHETQANLPPVPMLAERVIAGQQAARPVTDTHDRLMNARASVHFMRSFEREDDRGR